MPYSFFSSSEGNSTASRLVTTTSYELSVLKVYALPLLYTVKHDDPEYNTALRLIRLLDLVLPLPSEDVPSLSILREFIGTSYFED